MQRYKLAEGQDAAVVAVHAVQPVQEGQVKKEHLFFFGGDNQVVEGFGRETVPKDLLQFSEVAGIIGDARQA